MDSTTPNNPVSISAQELHKILLTAHAGGNLALRQFIDALRSMHETKLYRELGYSNIAAYADETFHYCRSQTLDFLRVSRALGNLPQIARAFELGEICISLVSDLSGVASTASEAEWLALTRQEKRSAVQHHIKYAKENKLDRPRRGGFGLPSRRMNLGFLLPPDEHAIVEAALRKIAGEMGESLEGKVPDPKTSLLYLAHRVLATEPAGSVTAGREERERSPFAVVFHRCPCCREAAVETEAGRVEVAAQAMERLEPGAEHVHVAEELPAAATGATSRALVPLAERDRPNTPKLRFVVRVRDGGRCSNPHCRRLVGADGHCHHIEFLCEGGRTTSLNETLVCRVCHAAIHAGALVIEGDPIRGLEWKVVCADLTRSVRENLEQIIQQASVRVVEIPAVSGIPDTATTSPVAEIPAALAATVRRALEVLGCSTRQAKEALELAWNRLLEAGRGRESISEESLIREACRSR